VVLLFQITCLTNIEMCDLSPVMELYEYLVQIQNGKQIQVYSRSLLRKWQT